MIKEISVHDLQKLKNENVDFFLLDVREPFESEICSLGGTLISMNELPARVAELDPKKLTIVYCRSGGRSGKIVAWLEQQGFEKVYNLQGGVTSWAREIDSSMATY
jgi:rhodanese-related sulfurtransferase